MLSNLEVTFAVCLRVSVGSRESACVAGMEIPFCDRLIAIPATQADRNRDRDTLTCVGVTFRSATLLWLLTTRVLAPVYWPIP